MPYRCAKLFWKRARSTVARFKQRNLEPDRFGPSSITPALCDFTIPRQRAMRQPSTISRSDFFVLPANGCLSTSSSCFLTNFLRTTRIPSPRRRLLTIATTTDKGAAMLVVNAEDESDFELVKAAWNQAKKVIVLTGAGISTACGISVGGIDC